VAVLGVLDRHAEGEIDLQDGFAEAISALAVGPGEAFDRHQELLLHRIPVEDRGVELPHLLDGHPGVILRVIPSVRHEQAVGDELGIEVRRADHRPFLLDGELREVGNPFAQETEDADERLRVRYDWRESLALKNERSITAFDGDFLLVRSIDGVGVVVRHDS